MAKHRWTHDEIRAFREKKGMFLYFNSEDMNLFVPKVVGLGFTLNFAHPLAWALMAVIATAIVWKVWLS